MANSKVTTFLRSNISLTGFERFIHISFIAIIINVADSLMGKYIDLLGVYILLATIPPLIVSLYLYKKNKKLAAKTIAAITYNLVFYFISINVGLGGGTYFYYFPFMISFIYMFQAEEDDKYALVFVIASLLCLIFILITVPYPPVYFKAPPERVREVMFLSFITSFILTMYYFYIIYKYQQSLSIKIYETEQLNKRKELRSIIEIQETERESIVNELRNNINQTLATSKFLLDKAKEEHTNNTLIEKSYNLTQEAIEQLSLLCVTLNPSIITDIGFIDGTKEYINNLRRFSSVTISFNCWQPAIEDIDPKDKVSLFRIIQDYISIVLRNPKSKNITITINYASPHISLSLSQDDESFNFMQTPLQNSLSDIKNRINYFNGTIRQAQSGDLRTALLELSLTE
jgi:signal transduction histidine kinase